MKIILFLFPVILLLTACEPQNNISVPPMQTPNQSPAATEMPQKTTEPEASDVPIPELFTDPTPEPTEAPPQKTLIGEASTPLLDKSENRVDNIALAAEQISGVTVDVGETFSFNATVGKRSAESGYKSAPIIVDGKKKMSCGGGVCQLSTTIFQAAEAAGLEIIERHNHQKNVGYAEPGQDAAVNYGTLDMQFVNSSDSPIVVALAVESDTVHAEIYRVN